MVFWARNGLLVLFQIIYGIVVNTAPTQINLPLDDGMMFIRCYSYYSFSSISYKKINKKKRKNKEENTIRPKDQILPQNMKLFKIEKIKKIEKSKKKSF